MSCHDLFVKTPVGDVMHLWNWSDVSMSAWDVVGNDVDEDSGKQRLDVCQVSLERIGGGEDVSVVRIVVEVVVVVELM